MKILNIGDKEKIALLNPDNAFSAEYSSSGYLETAINTKDGYFLNGYYKNSSYRQLEVAGGGRHF